MAKHLTDAIAAYGKSNYEDAIEILLDLLEKDRQNWRAWFYLAMSYGDSGRAEHGDRIMQVISTLCPDRMLKLKARIASIEFQSQMAKESSPEAGEDNSALKSA